MSGGGGSTTQAGEARLAEDAEELRRIYENRFSASQVYRDRVWQILTRRFFSRWIREGDAVLDLGCGYGEFINNVRCARKFAMDLNPDARARLASDVSFLEQDCSAQWPAHVGPLDVVFTSNFFEHLPSKRALRMTLEEAHRALKPDGLLICLGPNIRYLHGAYWDFFDHHVALSDRSLAEVLNATGFRVRLQVARFLPYTMVGGREYPLTLVRLYLALPALWRLLGRQFLLIASPTPTS